MTNKTQFKSNITASFNARNYFDAFNSLFTLKPYEIAHLMGKNKWLEQKSVSDYFWSDFCISNHQVVFSNKTYEIVLQWYLLSPKTTVDELNKILINLYPSQFIKGIKRNRAFLNVDFLTMLNNYNWADEFHIEMRAFESLQSAHASKQKEINEAWNNIKDIETHKLLCSLIYYTDTKFFDNSKNTNLEIVQFTYNYAVTYILSKSKVSKSTNEQQFDEFFVKTVDSTEGRNTLLFLSKIAEWIQFESSFLSSYCFDDNFKALIIDGVLDFDFISKEKYSAWKQGDNRYLVNTIRYYIRYKKECDNDITADKLIIPNGRRQYDKEINYNLEVMKRKSTSFLQDLNIRNLIFSGRHVHFSKFLGGLMSFSINRQFRYVETMNHFLSEGANWKKSMMLTLYKAEKEGVSNNPLPYLYMTIDELISIYQYAIPELDKTEIEDLLNHFSYTIKQGHFFNPLQVKYSVFETPFLKIGNYIFTSTSLFATNDWFYSIAQRCLNIYANYSNNKKPN
jgi:hypothetical protein